MLLRSVHRCRSLCPRLQQSQLCLAGPPVADRLCLTGPPVADRHTNVRHLGHRSKVMKPVFKEFNERRAIVEKNYKVKEENPIDRRSSFNEWNYGSELFAFSARLGESIPNELLTEAFTTQTYIEAEMEKQKELQIEGVDLHLKSNEQLSERGLKIIEKVVVDWIRGALPALPEEGVQAVKNFLLSEDIMANISFHIGTKDLIQSVEYPPTKTDYKKSLQAVVGAIGVNDMERAEKFVLEIIVAQLVGQDIDNIWDVRNPMGVLATVLKNENRGEPESRLLWKLGPGTLLASYTVGIYSDKQLIGESAGESVEIAEEMAARDALRKLFRISKSSNPLPVKTMFENTKPNLSIQDWSSDKLPNLVMS